MIISLKPKTSERVSQAWKKKNRGKNENGPDEREHSLKDLSEWGKAKKTGAWARYLEGKT